MSFLSEVISMAEKIEISTIVDRTSILTKKIQDKKENLLRYLNKVYVTFSQKPGKNEQLYNEIKYLISEGEQLESLINDAVEKHLSTAKSMINSYQTQFKEAQVGLKITNHLISLHTDIIHVENMLKEAQFAALVNKIKEMDEIIQVLKEDFYLEIFNNLLERVVGLKIELLEKMQNVINDHVRYYSDNSKNYLEIKVGENLKETFAAFALLDEFISPLHDLSRFLWDHIFYKVVNCKSSVIIIGETQRMEVAIYSEREKNKYEEVFANIETVLKFLEENFVYSLWEDVNTLQYIGNDLRDNLSELLIKNCLADTIPSTSKELSEYNVVVENVERLQNHLKKAGIFSEGMTTLSDYANNVELHFINKNCELYIIKAINIMKKDLHDTIEVGTPLDLSTPFTEDLDVFLQRSISKSCVELVEFTEQIIKKIFQTSELPNRKLYATLQKIFLQYDDVVLEHHQKLLKTIPQQVALFYNNCSFLNHKLTVWNNTLGKQLTEILKTDEPIFKTEGHKLQSSGSKAFVDFLEQQIKQIEEIMKESGLTNIKTLDKLDGVTEKSIRQCLRQQELLKTVWHKILTHSDYNESVGATLNSLCDFIIKSVVNFEDISSEAAEQLVDALKVIVNRGPKLFTDNKDVYVYVKNWYKLNELIFVLSSRLIEIDDRWADGKGPLALQFKSGELKRLIRALFQNTNQRAAVISKIKEVP